MPKRSFRVGRARTGLGLFATRLIKKRSRIAEYKGPLLTAKEAEKAENRGNRYLYEINSRWTIDGTPRSNLARYANHSCNPNADTTIQQPADFHLRKAQHQAGRGDRLRLRHRLSEERHRALELPMLALPPPARQAGAGTARVAHAAQGARGAQPQGAPRQVSGPMAQARHSLLPLPARGRAC